MKTCGRVLKISQLRRYEMVIKHRNDYGELWKIQFLIQCFLTN